MRARGAKVTDIVVLVVAADDGVMPQTREAIDHARAANVPIVVAVNKIDKPDANPERVKRELSELGLMPEAWGGTTVTVEVSARQRKNLDQLLEMILLVADLADLKANPKRHASGTVLEAKLDRGRGPVATVLVQDGTLSDGDLFIAGVVDGKVRALFDHLGRKIKKAGPATPVEVLGLSALPQPGDTFQVIDDPGKARQVVAYRQAQHKERTLGGKTPRLTLESLQQQMSEGGMKELPLIIKADVQGSAEVLADTLAKLTDEKVKIRIIHAGVGAINESDVLLAAASNAIIIGFNVRPDRNAAEVAEREKVDIRQHSVIYHVTDEMKKAMSGLLAPVVQGIPHWRGRNPADVQDAQVRHDRRLHGPRRPDHPRRRRAGPAAPRQRRGLAGTTGLAAPLQGRRERGQGRLGVRPLPRPLQRHQGGRYRRDLLDGEGPAARVTGTSKFDLRGSTCLP